MSDAASLEDVKDTETTYSEALQHITQRMVTMENKINNLLQKMEGIETRTHDIDFKEFVTKVEEIEADMEKFGQMMDRLLDEKEERETHINVWTLKINK